LKDKNVLQADISKVKHYGDERFLNLYVNLSLIYIRYLLLYLW